MSAAIFALLGAFLGVLGTMLSEVLRGRRETEVDVRRELREACVGFGAATVRVRQTARDIAVGLEGSPTWEELRRADHEMRTAFERLRLVGSIETQEAGRFALRYAYGLSRLAQGRAPRQDELKRHPVALLDEYLAKVYVSVRKELGVPKPERIFLEPADWFEWPGAHKDERSLP